MKKISLLCLLFIVSIVLTNAQETQIQINDPNDEQVSKPDSSPAARARRGSELLQQKLRLDNAQKSKVYDILLQQAKRTDVLKRPLSYLEGDSASKLQ